MCDDRTDYNRHARGGSRTARAPERGFTLIEVLIALAIVAVALGAVMRAIGALASDTDMARMRLLALWSADNALGEIRIASTRPSVGTPRCLPAGALPVRVPPVGGRAAGPLVRRVTVSVYPSASSRNVLAEVVTVIQNEARH